jgi:hypothetical protein
LGRFEDEMPRLGRAAIGVWVIARVLDDQARLGETAHPAMPAMGGLLGALANLMRAFTGELLATATATDVADAVGEVRLHRERCAQAASRRARLALTHEDSDNESLESEWLGYAALVVQVDRIAGDLGPPEPA